MTRAILQQIEHRPWPVPPRPWVMAQTWCDLLFAHWALPPAKMRERLPAGLEVDTFDGRAWIAVVPFRMEGVRARLTPALPWLGAFAELNVRTYVRVGDRPGVYFFSLDAANPVAVHVARAWFHLPYFRAAMSLRDDGRTIRYRSRRTHPGVKRAVFEGSYGPDGPPFEAAVGSLERWLTERYCLYADDPRGGLWRGEVHHAPWPLQPAFCEIEVNSMAAPIGLTLGARPDHACFARRLQTVEWAPVRARRRR